MRKKSLFNGKIRCKFCDCNMKKKSERGTVKYICSSYDNRGECIRNIISEEFLIDLIEKRLNKEVTRELIDEHVELIIIESVEPYLLEIYLKNQNPILFTKNGIQF